MKVSIIIPCFNMEGYVAQAIESALAQTYRNIEIIVVDDGSTDNSLSVIQRYDVVVVQQTNHGLAGARNSGLMNSTGALILPLDADDFISPDYLAKTVPLMQSCIGIVSTDFVTFGESEQYIKTRKPTLAEEMACNQIPVCSLIRRKALAESGGWNSRMDIYEDWFEWIDLMKRGWGVAVLNEPLFHYRVRNDSMVTESNKPGVHQRMMRKIRELHHDIF